MYSDYSNPGKMTTSVLKSLSVSITLETDEPITSKILVGNTAELEEIRKLQAEINTVITEKISSLKAENKLIEEPVEEESETEEDEE